MSEKIVQLNEEVIKGQLKELVRGSVEETLNGLLEAEAEKLTQAGRYERNEQRQGYRSGYYNRSLMTSAGEVTLQVPRLKGVTFETAITAMIYIYCKSTKMLSSYGLKGNLLYHSCFFDAAESEDETHLFSGFFMLVRLREKKDRW